MEITSNALREFMKTQPQTLEEYYERRFKQEIQHNIYMADKKRALEMLKNNEPIEKIQLYSGIDKNIIKAMAKKNNLKINDTEK